MTKSKKINDALSPSKIVAKFEKELIAPQRVFFLLEKIVEISNKWLVLIYYWGDTNTYSHYYLSPN
jgi:hypothetical protein